MTKINKPNNKKNKKNKNYMDKERVQLAMIEWKSRVLKIPGYPDSDIKKDRLKHAQMPDIVAQAILDTANNFINNYRFSKYTWREEMIGDAIVNCIKYLHNYNPEKYSNPHAYITMACESAFVQRIKKEKAKLATKYKYYTEEVFDIDHFDEGSLDFDFYSEMIEKVDEYEDSIKKQKEKQFNRRPKKKVDDTLDIFIGNDE